VGPTQLSTQCVDNVLARKSLGEAQHVPQILDAEATTVFCFQLLRQRNNDLLAVFGTLAAQYFRADALADPPVQHRQRRVDCDGKPRTGFANEAPDVPGIRRASLARTSSGLNVLPSWLI